VFRRRLSSAAVRGVISRAGGTGAGVGAGLFSSMEDIVVVGVGPAVVVEGFFFVGTAAAEVFWRFAGGGTAVEEAGLLVAGVGAGAGGADEETGASASAGSIAKMLALVLLLLLGILDEISSLLRIGGSEDGGAGPNGWTKGDTEAGGTRKGSTGKPESSESKFVACWPLLLLLQLLGGHGNMNGVNRPAACRWAAASRTGFASRLLNPARGS
jgi:hypothetical protein